MGNQCLLSSINPVIGGGWITGEWVYKQNIILSTHNQCSGGVATVKRQCIMLQKSGHGTQTNLIFGW